MSSNWTAKGDGWQLSWTDAEPYLEGPSDIRLAVLRELFKEDGVLVTPTGPSLPADTSSAEAGAIIVARLYPEAEWGNFPDLGSLWDDGTYSDDAVF